MKVGIMVDSLGMSQQSYSIIRELNKINSIDDYVDIIVFYHKYDQTPMSPHFAMMQEQEVWGFDGTVISTSLLSTEKLIRCPCPKKKLFYVWDLEWVYNPYLRYQYSKEIYQSEEIELIARSKSHANIIEACWKKPVAILEDFNHEQLISILT